MMMLSEIAQAVNGRMVGQDVLCTSVGTNSQKIEKNQLFIGVKGEKFDGSQFAKEAITNGASAAIVSEKADDLSAAVVVKDTKIALGKLAQHWRKKFELPVIAITGSNGKTTVKEMLAAILQANGANVLATEGNLNNDIGMPLTLLKLRDAHQFAVIEMGMNHEKEIEYLTLLASPKIALVNNAGTAHIGELGSREAIARAKGEIYSGLQTNGMAIINADDVFANYWKGLNAQRNIITFGFAGAADVCGKVASTEQALMLKTAKGDVQIKLDVLGEHNLRNALAASAAAYALGIDLAQIKVGLESFKAVKGRLARMQGLADSLVIDDTYNANPDSMKAAIDVLATFAGKRVFVMGDMAELGTDAAAMHAEIGAYAKQKQIDYLLTTGEMSQRAANAFGQGATFFANVEPLSDALKAMLKPKVTVLVKGSRFMKMERVVAEITENQAVSNQSAGAH